MNKFHWGMSIAVPKSALTLLSLAMLAAAFGLPGSAQDSRVTRPLAAQDGVRASAPPATTFTTLHSFSGTDGEYPNGLVQGADGDFYGTTYSGGANGDGTVFKIAPSGTLTTLHSFDGTDGANSFAGVTLGANGNFYGTTSDSGANNNGTVFKITPNGTLTTLYSFCAGVCADGDESQASLVQGNNGNFYGATFGGGANNGAWSIKSPQAASSPCCTVSTMRTARTPTRWPRPPTVTSTEQPIRMEGAAAVRATAVVPSSKSPPAAR
jgi:uncharacterized repeat protein (TIGR03803 family)